MRKWKCTVCGYIHTGDEPPEKCPVCGADRSKFVEIDAPAAPPDEPLTDETGEDIPRAAGPAPQPFRPTPPVTRSRRLYLFMTRMMTKFHAHPISVHIPNGVLPVAVIFLLLGLYFDAQGLVDAAFYNLIMVVLIMPKVIFSGYVDWQNRYGGNLTSLFVGKMICGALVTLIGAGLVIWRLINPEVLADITGGRQVFIGGHLIMLAIAAIAGMLGGRLVFRDE